MSAQGQPMWAVVDGSGYIVAVRHTRREVIVATEQSWAPGFGWLWIKRHWGWRCVHVMVTPDRLSIGDA